MSPVSRPLARHLLLISGLCALVVLSASFKAMQLRGQTSSVSVSLEVFNPATDVGIHVRAKPEKRIPSTGNDGTQLTVEVRNPGETTPLFSQTVVTSSGGTYSGLTLTGISAGTYDVAAKGYSHLRRTLANVSVSSGLTIDFTSNGSNPLPSGDVNAVSGDNKVNGIDLTLIVNSLFGHVVRYDLNRDGLVNGIDLTNAVTNLNDLGDA